MHWAEHFCVHILFLSTLYFIMLLLWDIVVLSTVGGLYVTLNETFIIFGLSLKEHKRRILRIGSVALFHEIVMMGFEKDVKAL